MKKSIDYSLLILMFLLGLSVLGLHQVLKFTEPTRVYAEREDEDEEHEEDEDEDEDEDDHDEDQKIEYVTEEVEVEEPVQNAAPVVTKQIAPGFSTDTDGDGLVDAIDPHPTINEKLFFTDSDGDTVPDALDQHPNEDDYSYMEFTDSNSNGISDDVEPN